MARPPIAYQADLETSAPHSFAASTARKLSTWVAGVAARSARAIAQDFRVRRDTRKLMLMSDHMLKDIGLTRAEIGRAVRYGRD